MNKSVILIFCIFFTDAIGQTINNLYYSLNIPYGFDTLKGDYRSLTKKERDEMFNSFQKKDSTVFGAWGSKIDIWEPDKNYFKIDLTKGNSSGGYGIMEVLFWENDTITIVGIYNDQSVWPSGEMSFIKFIGTAPGSYVELTDIIPLVKEKNYKYFFVINNTNSEEINNCISHLRDYNAFALHNILYCSFSNPKHNEISIGIDCYHLPDFFRETYIKYKKTVDFTWNMEKGVFELKE